MNGPSNMLRLHALSSSLSRPHNPAVSVTACRTSSDLFWRVPGLPTDCRHGDPRPRRARPSVWRRGRCVVIEGRASQRVSNDLRKRRAHPLGDTSQWTQISSGRLKVSIAATPRAAVRHERSREANVPGEQIASGAPAQGNRRLSVHVMHGRRRLQCASLCGPRSVSALR